MSDTRIIYDASTGVNFNQICHTATPMTTGEAVYPKAVIAVPFLAPAIRQLRLLLHGHC
jgi:hypothetical protein